MHKLKSKHLKQNLFKKAAVHKTLINSVNSLKNSYCQKFYEIPSNFLLKCIQLPVNDK